MAVVVTFVLLGIAIVLTLQDWRLGLFATIAVGFLQDPLRKLVPEQPVYFVVLVGVMFAAIVASALARGVRITPAAIYGWGRKLVIPFMALVVLVALQSARTTVIYASPILGGLGLLVYLTPMAATIIGYHFAAKTPFLVPVLMKFYLALCFLILSGVYLEYMGFDWPVLGEVGSGIVIYDVGTVLTPYAGFSRASEVAAWHAATGVCILLMAGMWTRKLSSRLFIVLGVLFLVGVGILTGRRKMLVEISIFVSVYWGLLAYFHKGAIRMALLAAAIAATGFAVSSGLVGPASDASRFGLYMERGKSVFEEIPDRLRTTGLDSLVGAIQRHGFFGAGAGTAAQGAQYFGGGTRLVGGAAEGGLGKIVTELGVPGLIVMAWFAVAMIRHVWRILRRAVKDDPDGAKMVFGFVAFICANASAFVVATQVYGDILILLILGWIVGFVVAAPYVAMRNRAYILNGLGTIQQDPGTIRPQVGPVSP